MPRSTSSQAISNAMASGPCQWPECDQPAWTESGLPICARHAVRVYLAVQDVMPSRVDIESDAP